MILVKLGCKEVIDANEKCSVLKKKETQGSGETARDDKNFKMKNKDSPIFQQ